MLVAQSHSSNHNEHAHQRTRQYPFFCEDDIPPNSADPETYSKLRDLWTQRLHLEETLSNLLRYPLDIDIDDEFERLDAA